MRYSRHTRLITAAAAAVIALAACARSGPVRQSSSGDVAPAAAGSITVDVRNDNFADMDVYVVAEGLPTRLGTVTGNSRGSFRLDASFVPTDQLRVVATPIGGNGRASSGTLLVSPGQTVEFRIAPVLRQSSASVH